MGPEEVQWPGGFRASDLPTELQVAEAAVNQPAISLHFKPIKTSAVSGKAKPRPKYQSPCTYKCAEARKVKVAYGKTIRQKEFHTFHIAPHPRSP